MCYISIFSQEMPGVTKEIETRISHVSVSYLYEAESDISLSRDFTVRLSTRIVMDHTECDFM